MNDFVKVIRTSHLLIFIRSHFLYRLAELAELYRGVSILLLENTKKNIFNITSILISRKKPHLSARITVN